LQRKVLSRRDAIHIVRLGDRVHVSVGRSVPDAIKQSSIIFWSMLSFITLLMVGYVYALKKGALDFKKVISCL